MSASEPIRDKLLVKAILNNLKESGRIRDYLLVAIPIYTGLRISDVLKLQVKDIRNKWNLRIKEQKTGKEIEIYLKRELKDIIDKNTEKKKPSEYIICSQKTKGLLPLSKCQAHRIIKKIQKEYKIPGKISSHSLRKTFAYTIYKENGNDIELTRQALNHQSTNATIRYLGIQKELVNKAIKNLPY